jgi:hypothetical protein
VEASPTKAAEEEISIKPRIPKKRRDFRERGSRIFSSSFLYEFMQRIIPNFPEGILS